MNVIGIVIAIIGVLIAFGGGSEPQQKSTEQQLADSFNAEMAELDRMERELREAVKR